MINSAALTESSTAGLECGKFSSCCIIWEISVKVAAKLSVNNHLSSLSNDLVGAQTVTDDLFPADGDADEGAELDGVVTRINLDLVDDYPASDPRWAESVPDGEEGH